GGGTWALAGNSNGYRNTIISQGTASIGNGGTSGSAGTGSVLIASGATLALNRTDLFTFANPIEGDGNIAKNGSGTVIIPTNNTFTGSVTINQGVIRATANNAFGSGAKSIVADTRNKGIELDGGVVLPSSISLVLSNDGDLT